MAPATHWIVLRIPAIGPIVRNVNLARFTLVFGTMLRSGVPITQSITICAQVLTNRYYQAALMKTRNDLERGEPLSEVDAKLVEIQIQHNIQYAGPVAGYKAGLYETPDTRFLVTKSPTIIAIGCGLSAYCSTKHLTSEFRKRCWYRGNPPHRSWIIGLLTFK